MKRKIIQISSFSKEIDGLVAKKKLLANDFDLLKKKLAENPALGTVIPGTGGLRKIRLKSASKGKSGGFRICYFDDSECEELFLMIIYQKNDQEDLTSEEKKLLKEMIRAIKTR